MEQERERQRTGSQPKDSQQSTLPFVSVADTFHSVPVNVSLVFRTRWWTFAFLRFIIYLLAFFCAVFDKSLK